MTTHTQESVASDELVSAVICTPKLIRNSSFKTKFQNDCILAKAQKHFFKKCVFEHTYIFAIIM